MRLATVYFFLGLSVVQCNRPADFLHRVVDKVPENVSFRTKVKEVQGNSKLDVLWVIDNSGSMQTHQQRVIDNSADFMKAFTSKKHLDWKMGLVSTHVGDQPYVGFTPTTALDKSTPDPVGTFQGAVKRLGWNQGCPELVFEPVMDAFKNYPGFSRKRSILVLIALTDTMEEVSGMQQKFEKALRAEKGDMKYVRFYGTFSGESFGCPSWEPRWLYPGSPFEYFVNLTGGKTYVLCSPDFGKDLAKLGEEIAHTVTHSKISLTARPDTSTLRVFYKGEQLVPGPQDAGGRWYYDFDLNAVSFYDLEFTDDEESEIDISYNKL